MMIVLSCGFATAADENAAQVASREAARFEAAEKANAQEVLSASRELGDAALLLGVKAWVVLKPAADAAMVESLNQAPVVVGQAIEVRRAQARQISGLLAATTAVARETAKAIE